MKLGYPTKTVKEGKASLLVPELDKESGEPVQHLRSEAPVFYNPVMRTNRDTAMLVIRAYQRQTNHPVTVCEPMTGCGVRGVRFLLETHPIDSLVLGDLNPSALRLARENLRINNLTGKASLRELDASLLLSLHSYPRGRFDYIDIDPYGTPAPFIDATIMATKNHGVIALTATDMAPLCGVNKRACFRKYGGWPLHGDFCHESALRIMSGTMVRHAAVYEYGATPIFSYYSDHYIRAYYRIDRGARRADRKLKQLGYIKYCSSCLRYETSEDNYKDMCNCGETMMVGGPMWLGGLSSPEYTKAMLNDLEKLPYLKSSKTEEILRLVNSEHGYPVGFYVIDSLCRKVGVPSIATDRVIEAIRSRGHRVTRVHYDPRGIKTDATINELTEIFNQFKK